MICFHHNDLDGRCSGFFVKHLFPECRMVELDYKDRFPLEAVGEGEEVFMVDFHLENQGEVLELYYKTTNLHWIDHHKSALDTYSKLDLEEPRGLRFDGIAACVLTWIYLYYEQQPVEESLWNVAEKAPYFARLIGDRDVWRFQYGKEIVNAFCMGLEAYNTDPEAAIWEQLFADDPCIDLINYISDRGIAIQSYNQQKNLKLVKEFSFETYLDGIKTLAVNTPRASSDLFGDKLDEYPICSTFCFDGKKNTISIYSKTIDVSVIAKQHGGGGHKGAAGFTCQFMPYGGPKDEQ